MRHWRWDSREGALISIPVPSLWANAGAWEVLWRWHPARLLGYDLRRRIEEDAHGLYHFWQYGRSKKVARETLRDLYAPTRCINYSDFERYGG